MIIFSTHLRTQKGFYIITARTSCIFANFENLSAEKQLHLFLKGCVYLCLCGTDPTFLKYIFNYFCYFHFTGIFLFQGTSFVSTDTVLIICVVLVFSRETKRSCYLPYHVSLPLLEVLDMVCYRPNIFLN